MNEALDPNQKPPYLDRIDELEKMNIVRLKGNIDQTVIPVIESRIQYNRKHGGTIDRNVVLDFAKVEHVDSATIAFHIVRLKEYQSEGFKAGFINLTDEMRSLLEIFKEKETFQIFASEEEAIEEFNC